MKLNLRQIEVFRAVMLNGSISGAAKHLFVSQPAVSRLISYTEQRLGFELFQRIKGRLYPTPEARKLYEEVSHMYQGIQRVNDVAKNLADNREGQLSLGCSPNLGQSLLPRAIAAYRQRFPDVRITLQTLIPSPMLQALLSHQIDIGIAYMPNEHPSLKSKPLFENYIVAAIPYDHPLAGREQIKLQELLTEDLIGYSDDIPFGLLIDQMFERHASHPVPMITVQQAHVACALVQAGVGIALVDEMTAKGPIWNKVTTVPIEGSVSAPTRAFHVELAPLSRLAQEFIKELKKVG